MGQYYRLAFKHDNEQVVFNDRYIANHDYIMAKLMEHSWMKNPLMIAVAREMYKNPMRLIWCGDYAEPEEVTDETSGEVEFDQIWCEDSTHKFYEVTNKFEYMGKWFCNHDKKLAIPLDKYIEQSTNKDGWCVCPFSLLTAIGNGRGGGDYHGVNVGWVGDWAWKLISI
jgi:hypothetical protein